MTNFGTGTIWKWIEENILARLTPDKTAADAGKFLKATETGTEWGDVEGTLPEMDESSLGKYLKHITTGAAWADPPTELPTGGNEGDVLTKGASGVEWAPVGEPEPSATAETQVSAGSASRAGTADNALKAFYLSSRVDAISGTTIELPEGAEIVGMRVTGRFSMGTTYRYFDFTCKYDTTVSGFRVYKTDNSVAIQLYDTNNSAWISDVSCEAKTYVVDSTHIKLGLDFGMRAVITKDLGNTVQIDTSTTRAVIYYK